METLHVIILSLVQGITEFLPISSSAHLVLVPMWLGWPIQSLAFDIAVHLGTLFAVVHYFRADITRLTIAWFASLKGTKTADSAMAWYVLFASIPALAAGALLMDAIDMVLRTERLLGWTIAATTIGFGLLLWVAEYRAQKQGTAHDGALDGAIDGYHDKRAKPMTLRASLAIGAAQALALIPGTSRSGITMTAALLLGYSRVEAARFSMLLAIPIILAASAVNILPAVLEAITLAPPMATNTSTLNATSSEPLVWQHIVLGTLLSGLIAWLAIHALIRWVAKVGFMPFVYYRLLLGGVLVAFLV